MGSLISAGKEKYYKRTIRLLIRFAYLRFHGIKSGK